MLDSLYNKGINRSLFFTGYYPVVLGKRKTKNERKTRDRKTRDSHLFFERENAKTENEAENEENEEENEGRKRGTVTYFSRTKTTIPVNIRSSGIISYLSGDKDEIFIKIV
jgi:hypothetical protein